MDDEAIRAALRRGDTDLAIRLVSRTHGKAIYSTACRMLHDQATADDIMQQTLITAANHQRQLLEVEDIRGWLIRVATRKCLDALRRSKRVDRLHRDGGDADAVDPGDLVSALGDTEERRALEECLAALPPEIAQAVVLRYREGMSWEQIAEAVAVPLDTVRMRVMRRAINSLRECLKSKGFA